MGRRFFLYLEAAFPSFELPFLAKWVLSVSAADRIFEAGGVIFSTNVQFLLYHHT